MTGIDIVMLLHYTTNTNSDSPTELMFIALTTNYTIHLT